MSPPDSPPPFSLAERVRSFRHAIAGLRSLVAEEHNARVHLAATLAVIVAAAVLEVSRVEAGLLALAIGGVWTAELLNTAIEAVVDLVSPDRHPLAKTAKDAGAAAVLVASVAAVVIGLCVFGPAALRGVQR